MNSYNIKSWLMQLIAIFLTFIVSLFILAYYKSDEYFLWLVFNIAQPFFIHSIFRRNRRLKFLTSTYGEMEGKKIYKGIFWQGMPAEGLKHIWGEPLSIDRKVNKNNVVEIWKYNRVTKKSFGTKFTIENGKLTGWDIKEN